MHKQINTIIFLLYISIFECPADCCVGSMLEMVADVFEIS